MGCHVSKSRALPCRSPPEPSHKETVRVEVGRVSNLTATNHIKNGGCRQREYKASVVDANKLIRQNCEQMKVIITTQRTNTKHLLPVTLCSRVLR